MLRKLDAFVPAFLKKIDHQLLINRPGLWATRLHYVGFYVGIALLLALAHAAITPLSLQDLPDPDTRFGLLWIPVGLGFMFYLWRSSLQHPQRFFGRWSGLARWRDLGVHALVLALMASVPFLYAEVLSERMAARVSTEKLTQDLNVMNLGARTAHSWTTQNPHSLQLQGYYFGDNYGYSMLVDVLQHDELDQEARALHFSPKRSQLFKKQFERTLATYSSISAPHLYVSNCQKRKAFASGGFESWTSDELQQALRTADENLSRLHAAKIHELPWQRHFSDAEGFWAMSFMMGICLLIAQFFLRMKFAHFVAGGIGLFAGAIALGLLGGFLGEYAQLGSRVEDIMFVVLLMLLGLLLQQGYSRRQTRRGRIWRSTALMGVIALLVILPIIAYEVGNLRHFVHFRHIDNELGVLLFGLALALFAWLVAVGPRFQALQAEPTEN